MDSRLKSFVSPEILSREGYTPGFQPKGKGNLIKLNTNENPHPPSPNVAVAIQSQLDQLQLYPEPTSYDLRVAIAKRHRLQAQNVIIGNGAYIGSTSDTDAIQIEAAATTLYA